MNLKIQEGLLALLDIDERFAPTLFDFNEPVENRYPGIYERELHV